MAEGGQLLHEKEEILKRLDENLKCSICFGQYQDPRVLNCQHTFCAGCLKQHVGDSDIIKCPLCNNESAKPVVGIDGLGSNFFIKSLIEDVVWQKSEFPEQLKPKLKCGNCDEGNDGVSHCEDCGCNLCLHCEDMHQQIKALKDHKVTSLPTEKESLDKVKVKSEAMIERLTHEIHDQEAQLNTKILSLRNKIRGIEQKRDTEINRLRESHRELLVKIDEYVQQLSTKINSSAAVRLGDMPQELAACEQQLNTYMTLKQQGWMISNIQIHKRIERCKELMKHIIDFQQRSQAVVYRGGNVDVKESKFIASQVQKQQLGSSFVTSLGYVTPIPSRFERKVEILPERNISPDMKDSLIEMMHDSLDHIGIYPATHDSLEAVREWVADSMKKEYPRQHWSIIVGYHRGYISSIRTNNALRVVIDNMMFTLFKT